MNLWNDTHNQHFLPQVEQRLNAANPDAPREKQRIYAFKIRNRETSSIELEHSSGRAISKNLSLKDLFSFDVPPAQTQRLNFEALFQRYESGVLRHTQNLLGKLAVNDGNVGDEIMNLFAAKILNFARNPFSITKILNTFGKLADYEPTATLKKQMFDRILHGRKPHQERLCAHLGISDSDYTRWLRMLFMLFVEYDKEGTTMLDGAVKGLFELKDHDVAVLICTYSSANCLMSDRSFSTNSDCPSVAGFDFNLRSNAFIRYIFADVDGMIPPNAPRSLVEAYKAQKRPIRVDHQVDDLDLLRGFNRTVIAQCHSRVFCSGTDAILV